MPPLRAGVQKHGAIGRRRRLLGRRTRRLSLSGLVGHGGPKSIREDCANTGVSRTVAVFQSLCTLAAVHLPAQFGGGFLRRLLPASLQGLSSTAWSHDDRCSRLPAPRELN